MYGDHAFFLGMESNGDAYGVFLLNSNAKGRPMVLRILIREIGVSLFEMYTSHTLVYFIKVEALKT